MYSLENRVLEFAIMVETDIVASVYVNFEKQQVNIMQYTDRVEDRPFLKDDSLVTISDIMDFFESRCFPRTRFNCQQLLEDLGLSHYSPLAIVRKTHGLQFDDYTWVRFKGEDIKYEAIKIRD